jgi:hypothetical protein
MLGRVAVRVRTARRDVAQAASGTADHTTIPPHEGTAMNLSPEQIQEHVAKLSEATVEEIDDLLHDLCCLAWPTTDSQNN